MMITSSSTLIIVLHIFLIINFGNVFSFSFFRDRIPNGYNVPHPCENNVVWLGVGHQSSIGGDDRNPFGVHFEKLGRKWSTCLCNLDSDGDGMTNGEELGDPNCIFVEGDKPTHKTGITHPGVCEPITSSKCIGKNTFLTCRNTSFSCPQFGDSKSVQSLNLMFPRTSVPPVQTTYICKLFDLPTDGDYSLIGYTPAVNNADVMHHILLFGCADESAFPDLRTYFTTPNATCGMVPTMCQHIIAVWSVGQAGECLGDNYGFRIGNVTPGIKVAIMQIHWNNPMSYSNYTDASGLKIYYTPNKRPNDAGTIFLGTNNIIIPPQQYRVDQHGLCPEQCTQRMFQNSTIYIPEIVPHMHLLGWKMKVSIKKNGTTTFKTVMYIENYTYENPQAVKFDPPLQLAGGDEVNVSCSYFSVNKNNYTFSGEDTSSEMCYAVTTYYPFIENTTMCLGQGGILAECGMDELANGDLSDACDTFWLEANSTSGGGEGNSTQPPPGGPPGSPGSGNSIINATVFKNCDVVHGLNCTAACKNVIANLTAHFGGCFTNNFRPFLLGFLAGNFPGTGTTFRSFALGLLSCEPMYGLGNTSEFDGTAGNPLCSACNRLSYSQWLYSYLVTVVLLALVKA